MYDVTKNQHDDSHKDCWVLQHLPINKVLLRINSPGTTSTEAIPFCNSSYAQIIDKTLLRQTLGYEMTTHSSDVFQTKQVTQTTLLQVYFKQGRRQKIIMCNFFLILIQNIKKNCTLHRYRKHRHNIIVCILIKI